MTSDIAQAITLTTHGNAFLRKGHDISGLTLEHPSFLYDNVVSFVTFKKRFFGKPREQVYAGDPVSWLKKLKFNGYHRLRFMMIPDNSQAPDHKLAGFVGGGGRRLIFTDFGRKSDGWMARQVVTRQDAPDNRIWTVTYGRIIDGATLGAPEDYDIPELRERLDDVLGRIKTFAEEQELTHWATRFSDARNALIDVSKGHTFKPMIPYDLFPDTVRRLLDASGMAWVFGGMGSWNDNGFAEKEVEAKYDALSAELYSVINECYMAIANYTVE